MKISVVTAVFNRQNTIAQAVQSLQAQRYENFEHLIQDGGSTDGTVQILHDTSDERTRLVSEADGGIYDAINKGIARATGDVIGLMHSDDYYASDYVLEWVAEAFSDPSVDGVYGDLKYVSASDTSKVIRYWVSGEYDPKNLSKGWMPPHPTLYLRREVFEKWGTYDTRFEIAADYDAMMRYLVKGDIKLGYIPKVLVKMRIGGESNRTIANIVKKRREDYSVMKFNSIGGFASLLRKNTSKVGQFFKKGG